MSDPEPYTQVDLLHIALRGEPFDPLRVVATFAKRENWTQLYQEKRCWWSWVGPVVPPYELAQNMLRRAHDPEPQLCHHDDSSWCTEECAAKVRALRAWMTRHGLRVQQP